MTAATLDLSRIGQLIAEWFGTLPDHITALNVEEATPTEIVVVVRFSGRRRRVALTLVDDLWRVEAVSR